MYEAIDSFPYFSNSESLLKAAAGGTGRLLVQLCKHYGAFVIGTTSTPEKAATAKAAGADEVILYTEKDVPSEVARITNGKGNLSDNTFVLDINAMYK